jgi:choice-of-anchor A domain-containing protein
MHLKELSATLLRPRLLRLVGSGAVAVAGVTLVPGAAGATNCVPLGAAANYNEYVTGTASESSDTVSGAAAYGGVSTVSAATYGGSLAVPAVALVLGTTGNQVFNTSLSAAGNSADYVGSLTTAGNTPGSFNQVAASSLPINFSTAGTALSSASSTLAGLTATNTTTGSTALLLSSAGTGTDVFSVSTSQLVGATSSITVNAPAGAVVVINVSGTNLSMTAQNISLGGGVTAADVIWNFASFTPSSSLSLSVATWFGTVLLPSGFVSLSTSHFNGSVLDGGTDASFSDNTVNNNLFTGCIASGPGTPTPEVPTGILLPLAAVGVMGGGFLIMRRRRNRLELS